MRHILVLFLLLLVDVPARADDDPRLILAAAAGQWQGELYYLDYQSGQRFAIPMAAEISMTADGATQVKNLTWTDPGNLVYAVNLVTVDRETGELVEAFFREGQGQYMRYQVESAVFTSDTNWQLVYEHDGLDANRPARIRHTMERDGDSMTSIKSVRFLDDDSTDYFERNGTRLELTDGV